MSINEYTTSVILPKIVLVEDDPLNRKLISRWLQDYASQLIAYANAEEAIENFSQDKPDILISDIRLQGKSGLDLCTTLKQFQPQLATILITAYNDHDALLQALNMGVDHLLMKPVEQSSLVYYVGRLSKIKQTQDHLAKSSAELILKNQMLEQVRRKEQETCAGIQNLILYHHPPERVMGAKLAFAQTAAQIANGDFLDHHVFDDYGVDLIIGDAMGKGLTAALLAAGVKSGLMRAMSHSKKSQVTKTSLAEPMPITEIVQAMVQDTYASFQKLESFVTLQYLRLHAKSATLEWLDCGHGKIIFKRAHQKHYMLLSGDNLPLGVSANDSLHSQSMPLLAKDCFYLASDGITEVTAGNGQPLQYHGLIQLISEMKRLTIHNKVHHILDRAMDMAKLHPSHEDDKTLLAVELDQPQKDHFYAHQLYPARLVSLSSIRTWLHAELSDDRFSKQTTDPSTWLDSYLLGVTECISNILRHGVLTDTVDIELSLILDGNVAHLEILYLGKYFNRRRYGSELPSHLSEGEYGLFLIDQIFDEARYYSDEGPHQAIVLRKNLV